VRAIDFHALPFPDEPLAAHVPVEYSLDLPVEPEPPAGPPRDGALVVADPTLDLPLSRAEAENVAASLRRAGAASVEVLEGPRATNEAILARLPGVRLFHYAGHGVFAGREGWESGLPLAAGGHLSIADVLAMRDMPSRVVLSGCETARGDLASAAESIGLAQAFAISGADVVIAPVRPVDEALSARVSQALYGGLATASPAGFAALLRDAQVAIRKEKPEADWSAFRVVRRGL
jgi:CHAT domain-containing protein